MGIYIAPNIGFSSFIKAMLIVNSSLFWINSLVPSKGSISQKISSLLVFPSPSSEIIGISGNNFFKLAEINSFDLKSAIVKGESSFFL